METGNYFLTGKEVASMRSRHPASFREQVSTLRRQFLQDGDLPFTDVLTEEVLAQALAAVTGWRTGSSLPWSPCGSSWGRSSVQTIPAAPPSPA
jgi:hypothetical protein